MQSVIKKSRVKLVSRKLFIATLVLVMVFPYAAAMANDQNSLAQWLAAPHRTKANAVRDGDRHPVETLGFFGVKDTSTVVEILPGSRGYYLEILAPYLRSRGVYIAANRDELAAPRYLEDHQKFLARLKEDPQLFDKVQVTKFNADMHEIAKPGSCRFRADISQPTQLDRTQRNRRRAAGVP